MKKGIVIGITAFLLVGVLTGCLSLLDSLSWGSGSNEGTTEVLYKGAGEVSVDSEYITYRNVTRSSFIHGSMSSQAIGGAGGSSYSPGTPDRIETVTTREPATEDHELPFKLLKGDSVVYNGYTPIRVTNLDPGETYTIIWVSTNGETKNGTVTIPNTSPYKRFIHIE